MRQQHLPHHLTPAKQLNASAPAVEAHTIWMRPCSAHRQQRARITEDEVRFYFALIEDESAVRKLADDTLKKIAHELTENLRVNLSVDWSARKSVQAKLRLMVKRILRKYKYPPDHQDAAVELVLEQVREMGESWSPA